jgi:hypothetical protein
MGINIGQRREALGRDGEVMVTGRRGSVFIGGSGFEGEVCRSGHDYGGEEDDGDGLIEGADASLYEEPKRRRFVSWLASRGKKRYDMASKKRMQAQ